MPTWNSLIADHLEPHTRGSYFARRAKIIASLGFVSLCVAGGLLSFWQQRPVSWLGFVLIFFLAGGARLISLHTLESIEDVHQTPVSDRRQGFRSFLAHSTGSFRRFLLFSGLMHMAVLVAGPFFVLYLLQDLRLSYLDYGSWMAAGVLGQLVTLQAWGRFSDRFGNKALLSVTSFTVPVLPMLYLVSTDLFFLLLVNFLGGVVWAGLSLGLQNYVFDAVGPEDRATAVAVNSAVNAAGWSVGALLGSWLVETLPAGLELAGSSLPLASNLPLVFTVSGLLRLAVSAGLLGSFQEVRSVEQASLPRLLGELPLVKPLTGLVARPFSRLGR
jgi:MFS family permease